VHLRRIHYALISRRDTPPIPHRKSTKAYINTLDCWGALKEAARDARYLGFVPYGAIEDHRSEGATVHLVQAECGAELRVEPPGLIRTTLPVDPLALELPAPPDFEFESAQVDQRYHIEIWAEKSTVNDIIGPLGEQFGVNTLAGVGDISLTDCYKFVQRARASGRPARILYVSDFDPSGFTMPVSVARKIEYLIRSQGLDLDVQVRPVVLTHDQCVEYELPRTPIKETANGKAGFEERFGEGATELDALEALHPGVLAQILTEEIERYYDADLDDAVEETADAFRGDLEAVRDNVVDDHEEELDSIQADYDQLAIELNADIAALQEKYGARYAEIAGRFNVIDRYKDHQDRPTEGQCRAGSAWKAGHGAAEGGGGA
jgi:hypothetical protein